MDEELFKIVGININDREFFSKCNSFPELQLFLQSLADSHIKRNPSILCNFRINDRARVNVADTLIKEFDAIGWEHVVDIDENFYSIKLCVWDRSDRGHEFELQIPPNYPHQAPTLSATMPRIIQFDWDPNIGIKGIVSKMNLEVLKLQNYFNVSNSQVSITEINLLNFPINRY